MCKCDDADSRISLPHPICTCTNILTFLGTMGIDVLDSLLVKARFLVEMDYPVVLSGRADHDRIVKSPSLVLTAIWANVVGGSQQLVDIGIIHFVQIKRVVGGHLDLPLPRRKAGGTEDFASLSDIILDQIGIFAPRDDAEE